MRLEKIPDRRFFVIADNWTEEREKQYTFYFERAKTYYVTNIVIPTTILTFVSFGTFLLDLRVGERLSYGMALALVVVAQQIATGGTIPISNERLWIDKFIGWSFYWVIVGLVESVFVGYLYFLRQDVEGNSSDEERRMYEGIHSTDEHDNNNREIQQQALRLP